MDQDWALVGDRPHIYNNGAIDRMVRELEEVNFLGVILHFVLHKYTFQDNHSQTFSRVYLIARFHTHHKIID